MSQSTEDNHEKMKDTERIKWVWISYIAETLAASNSADDQVLRCWRGRHWCGWLPAPKGGEAAAAPGRVACVGEVVLCPGAASDAQH
jgi:hypothetical protein